MDLFIFVVEAIAVSALLGQGALLAIIEIKSRKVIKKYSERKHQATKAMTSTSNNFISRINFMKKLKNDEDPSIKSSATQTVFLYKSCVSLAAICIFSWLIAITFS